MSLAATVVLVRKAVVLPPHGQFGQRFLLDWVVAWPGTMLVLSVIAGGLVVRRGAPWRVVLAWPLLVGPTVGVGFLFALMPQMEPGSQLCHMSNGGSCDTMWGLGAAVMGVAALFALGGSFVAVASLKRLAFRLLK